MLLPPPPAPQWMWDPIPGYEDVVLEGVQGPHCAFTLLFQPSQELEEVGGWVVWGE